MLICSYIIKDLSPYYLCLIIKWGFSLCIDNVNICDWSWLKKEIQQTEDLLQSNPTFITFISIYLIIWRGELHQSIWVSGEQNSCVIRLPLKIKAPFYTMILMQAKNIKDLNLALDHLILVSMHASFTEID